MILRPTPRRQGEVTLDLTTYLHLVLSQLKTWTASPKPWKNSGLGGPHNGPRQSCGRAAEHQSLRNASAAGSHFHRHIMCKFPTRRLPAYRPSQRGHL